MSPVSSRTASTRRSRCGHLSWAPTPVEPDDLVVDDVAVLRHGAFLDHLEEGVVLHAGDEEDPGIGPFGEQPVVVVAPIIDHDGAGGEAHLVGGLDIMRPCPR